MSFQQIVWPNANEKCAQKIRKARCIAGMFYYAFIERIYIQLRLLNNASRGPNIT